VSRHGHRFYLVDPLHTGLELTLPEHISRQITSVLRLKPGDDIRLFNADGSEYIAKLFDVRREAVGVSVLRCEPGIALPPPRLTVALALIKHERFEWALQKLTELGVDRIVPLTTERTVLSFRVDRGAQRFARWQRIVVEAAEQSGRVRLPEIDDVVNLADLLSAHPEEQAILLWEDEQSVELPELFEPRPTLVVIGPEGGFSASEVAQAREMGCCTASLGPLTLRTETAAVAAASLMLAYRMTKKID
jgi:16S rRNA (uracil1498-N3)-methyltransferase